MKARKVLFITQQIAPYVPDSEMAFLGRKVPQLVQDRGREIRTFMPKWGNINERRSQLHEVIRLSGMNLIIDETDHLLILKVASIPSARMQVYFIDNDDYFQRRLETYDPDGVEYPDNGERTIFFARGVLETVKKLRWVPDIVHCQGWMSCIAPFYIKTSYREEPSFRDSRIIFTPGSEPPTLPMTELFRSSLHFKGAPDEVIDQLPAQITMQDLYKLALRYSDGMMLTPSFQDPELIDYAKSLGLPIYGPVDVTDASQAQGIMDFFDGVWGEGKEEIDTSNF